MMIDYIERKLKDLSQEIDESLTKQKISDCFLVGTEFQKKLLVLKAIKCSSDFISQESSARPWNHCNHFEEFIAAKEKTPFTLKDNRLNGNTVTFQKLDKFVLLHHVLEERNNEKPNYQLKTRGQLNQLKNTSHNLFTVAFVIKKVKYELNEKINVLQKKRMQSESNNKYEKRNDIDTVKDI